MQIHGLHKSVYRLYRYARTQARAQEYLDTYRQQHESRARHWQCLKAEGVSDGKCQEFVGLSLKVIIATNGHWITSDTVSCCRPTRPERVNKPR